MKWGGHCSSDFIYAFYVRSHLRYVKFPYFPAILLRKIIILFKCKMWIHNFAIFYFTYYLQFLLKKILSFFHYYELHKCSFLCNKSESMPIRQGHISKHWMFISKIAFSVFHQNIIKLLLTNKWPSVVYLIKNYKENCFAISWNIVLQLSNFIKLRVYYECN